MKKNNKQSIIYFTSLFLLIGTLLYFTIINPPLRDKMRISDQPLTNINNAFTQPQIPNTAQK